MVNMISYQDRTTDFMISGVKLSRIMTPIQYQIYHCDSSFQNSTDDMKGIDVHYLVSQYWSFLFKRKTCFGELSKEKIWKHRYVLHSYFA